MTRLECRAGQQRRNGSVRGHLPAGITLGTPQSSTIAAGHHLDLVAERNQQLTAGQGMHLHAGQGISQFAFSGGIKSIAH